MANLAGRAVLIIADRAVDVAEASAGRFGPEPEAVFARWPEFSDWVGDLADLDGLSGVPIVASELGAPSPRPPQVFGIGLNYRDHAEEAELDIPAEPMVFTKFPSAITGPEATVELSSDRCDFEAELCVVIGTGGHRIDPDYAWQAIAGLTIGQDLSDRRVQFRDSPPQFSLGKSFPGFAPVGPWLVTADELADADDLGVRCEIDGEVMQDGRSSDMIFPVAQLVSRLSSVVTLLPGDVIFTGTPAGVGAVRQPRRYLKPGQVITTAIEGIGSIRTTLA
ncbi:fumarylacetoacetate hydrolase family protein [Naumannella halotolerans]|uniref:2-keto-4-pentenoate hydratase/2-oxohepta-3-ene-1,7-dioic acid hydratase in catechol pathway n=1 Tax=Naumannella halotolerans TaxID=993414 RepID=A0A4V3EMR4_9ACTN|nr:fumarylacetoacetate hydrolase family protein [Naumannella halotolerans]TDT31018.1 2-keto-4-pentenoate hydratase/2-oxohepta-3-ene-1,7-dioic acid hydratase in catechol pathway [Naumannella halotolerans]